MKFRARISHILALALLATLFTAVPGTPLGASSDVTPIYEIQGEGHLSPFAGSTVTTTGVVTGIGFNSFWIQDPSGDGNDATSDGLFVFDSRTLGFSVGDCLQLTDRVDERIGGGPDTGNLSLTQMAFPGITVIDCDASFDDYSFPASVVIGESGRIAPNEIVISDDELPVNLQDVPGDFNPDVDGIDFYESMENMLVTIEAPQAVSATRQFGSFSAEFFTVPNGGSEEIVAPEDAINERGGIMLQPDPDNTGDQNPERIQVQFLGSPLYKGSMSPPPSVKVGDTFADINGIMSYSFGNFEVNAIDEVVAIDGGLTPETSKIKGKDDKVTVASYNVLNLSPLEDDDAQRDALAAQIVGALNSPDVIALQEIQDNSGSVADPKPLDDDGNPTGDGDDGVTSADETLQALVSAIVSAGGPVYAAFDVAPVDGSGGGVPGGNIRNAFLYNPGRVSLVDFVSLDTAAFQGTRRPLVATFEFNAEEFTLINVHLSSRFGSSPIFGGPQPFVQAAESGGTGREDQVAALNEYVDGLLDIDEDARVAVLGDFNTFEWTNDLTDILPGDDEILTNLAPTSDADKDDDDDDDEDHDDDGGTKLPEDAEYSFIFDGNSQLIDQFFVTDELEDDSKFDVVHLNVDFPRRSVDTVASDHDPLLASFEIEGDEDDLVKIQLLAISDWHAQLDPLSVFGEGTFGGAAELSTYFDIERANVENTLTLTAGDAYGASLPLSSFFDEEPAVRALRLMGLDVDTLGNHNFDQGIDHLQSLIDIASAGSSEVGDAFQYVSANLENRDDNLSGVKDYEIFEFDDVKVAVIGVTNPEAPTLVFPGSFGTINVTDPVVAANAARDAAEDDGADVFVLIAHMGLTGPGSGPLIDLANGVTGFDVIFGDHTDIEFSGVINGATVMESRSRGRTYARVQITYDTDNEVVVTNSATSVVALSADVTPDPAIVALLDPLRAQLDTLLSVVVGDSTVAIPRTDSCGNGPGRTCESLVGDVVTDALRSQYGTDFAITNSGGLRASLTCPTLDTPGDFCNAGDEGKITRGQILTVLPFGNLAVTLNVTGAELKDHLERGVSAMPGISGRFAQVSGLCFTYDINAVVGSRVTGAVRQAADGSCTGAVIDLTAASTYTLAENDFMANGGDGYPVDIGAAATRDFLDQAVEAYVVANTPISPVIQGRITCTGTGCPVATP